MRRDTIRLLARIAFWIAAAFAYVVAIIPGGEPAFQFSNDKANHILAFVTLSALARLGWSRGRAWIIAVLLIAFGGFIELSQAMPLIHRDPEFADFFADLIAVVIGLGVGTILLALVRKREAARAVD